MSKTDNLFFYLVPNYRTMNKTVFFLVIALCILSCAQTPSNYYQGTENLHGDSLKDALHRIIHQHIQYPYTASEKDVWDILKETDQDLVHPENIVLFYTGKSVNAAQEWNEGKGWNREHIWAKSRGKFKNSSVYGCDLHHIRPTHPKANSHRNNYWFANTKKEAVTINGENSGCYKDDQKALWEPRDEVKGDVARMLFYMDVRYEGGKGEKDFSLVDYFPNRNSTAPVHALLSDLLQWHKDDPVSPQEKRRNNIIYHYQRNRNPFIDHPEFASRIWGQTTKN